MGRVAGATASAVTHEAISYVSGEKELTWDNIQQSNITVIQNTTADLVVEKLWIEHYLH